MSRKMWNPSASILMSTRYWKIYWPATLASRMPRHCSATSTPIWSRFSSAHHTAASIPAMKNAFRTLHTMPTMRLRRDAGEKLPATSSMRFTVANIYLASSGRMAARSSTFLSVSTPTAP